MLFAEWEAEGPFVQWLLGARKAIAYRYLHSTLSRLTDCAGIEVDGHAGVCFDPRWVLQMEGSGLAKVHGFGSVLRSSSATVTLLDSSQPSILAEAAARRTLIVIERGLRRWRIDAPQSADGWKIDFQPNLYSSVKAEVG